MALSDLVNDAKSGSLLNNLIFGKSKDEKIDMKDYYDLDINKFIVSLLNQRNNFSSYVFADDPTVLGFSFKISALDPLWNITDKTKPSAYYYLLSVRQTDRAEKFKKFVEKFNILINQRNYFLQKLSGLGNIYEVKPESAFIERTITISTLESIDLFISSMIDDYNRSVYDYENMKNIVPVNLLYFDLIIIVNEIRNFKSFIDKKFQVVGEETVVGEKERDVDNMIYLNKHLGVHALRFNDCKMDFFEGNDYLNSLDNTAPQPISNKFKIKLGRLKFYLTDLEIFSQSGEKKIWQDSFFSAPYNQSDLIGDKSLRRFSKEPEGEVGGKKKLGDIIKDAAKKEAKKIAEKAVNAVDKQISNTVNLAESKMRDASGTLVNKYTPSNMVARAINKGTSKLMSTVNNGLNDVIDSFTDRAMNLGKKKTLPEAIINEYSSESELSSAQQIAAENKRNLHSPKDNISSRTKGISQEEMQHYNNSISSKDVTDITIDQSVETISETEKLRRDVSYMIIHGKTYDQYMKEVLVSAASNKTIQ